MDANQLAVTAPSVYIVDDNEDIRAMLTIAVEMTGRRASAFAGGAEAFAALESATRRPSLILLDLMMPGMTGQQFLERCAEDPLLACVPVVVISGDGRVAEKVAGTHAIGALSKPIELDTLLAAVERYA